MLRVLLLATVVGVSATAGAAGRTAAPEGASLYIVSPADGETVTSPVTMRFGAQGIGVAPAGIEAAATGHHHLIVDGELPAMGRPIPSNDTYRDFGGGRTETTIELSPGEHTLQLLMGDHLHVPHPPRSWRRPGSRSGWSRTPGAGCAGAPLPGLRLPPRYGRS